MVQGVSCSPKSPSSSSSSTTPPQQQQHWLCLKGRCFKGRKLCNFLINSLFTLETGSLRLVSNDTVLRFPPGIITHIPTNAIVLIASINNTFKLSFSVSQPASISFGHKKRQRKKKKIMTQDIKPIIVVVLIIIIICGCKEGVQVRASVWFFVTALWPKNQTEIRGPKKVCH